MRGRKQNPEKLKQKKNDLHIPEKMHVTPAVMWEHDEIDKDKNPKNVFLNECLPSLRRT